MELGLGLISIGRRWGHIERSIPSVEQVNDLLNTAVKLGIRYFDTAPAYGLGEERFGNFLKTLNSDHLRNVIVATKCGEYWDDNTSTTHVNHSYEVLCRSIDQSLARLPKIDILQIHKATPQVLADDGVRQALEYAKSKGIASFGVSVSDLETANIAVVDPMFSLLQFPFNQSYRTMENVFASAWTAGKSVFVNRPLGMGSLMYDKDRNFKGEETLIEAYKVIVSQPFRGAVLSGASSAEHLKQNLRAFQKAKESL